MKTPWLEPITFRTSSGCSDYWYTWVDLNTLSLWKRGVAQLYIYRWHFHQLLHYTAWDIYWYYFQTINYVGFITFRETCQVCNGCIWLGFSNYTYIPLTVKTNLKPLCSDCDMEVWSVRINSVTLILFRMFSAVFHSFLVLLSPSHFSPFAFIFVWSCNFVWQYTHWTKTHFLH